jgi:hypothetical protein
MTFFKTIVLYLSKFIKIYMRKLITISSLLLLSLYVSAQQGGRVGIIGGITKISMVNNDDAAANKKILQLLPTMGTNIGLEASYNWRFFGLGMQLMRSELGQNYNFYGQSAQTRLNYTKPCLFLAANSNPKNDIRFSMQLGAYYGILNNYSETSRILNPVTGNLNYTTFINKEFTITDTGMINGTIDKGIYFNSDAGAFGAIGVDVRFAPMWLVGIHARADYGMEKLENYEKQKQKYVIGEQTYSFDYEHWKGRTSKFDYQPTFTGVRTASTNMSMGVYISVRYLLMSQAVKEYEKYGY